MLLSLLCPPLFVWFYYQQQQRRRQAASQLGPLGVIQSRAGHRIGRQQHVPPLFFLLALTLLAVSLARPEMFVDLPRVEGTVILAFDVSNSMVADDLDPTRMEAAKTAAKAFVDNQPSTVLIGVVAFSNGGLIVQPPTNQPADVLAAIERLTPQGATSLSQGIFSSLNAIVGEAIPLDPTALEEGGPPLDIGNHSSAVILLLTDGENTESPDPLDIAQLAAEAGVRIYPVGLGTAEGTILQIEGFNILSQLNETTLQEIASLTNGTYYQAADEETLRQIYENIDLKLTIRGQKMEITAILAGLSLLFFLIGGFLSLLWFGRMP